MPRKFLRILIALLGIVCIFVSILLFTGYFKPKQAGLLIETEPTADVFINQEYKGKTPFDQIIPAGTVYLKLKPENGYEQFGSYETKLNLTPGVKTIVKKTFAETEEYASGAVVSFEKSLRNDSPIAVVSLPDNAQVSIDGRVYGFAPIEVKANYGEHNLTVSKDDYLDKRLTVKLYPGYKLTAFVRLAKQKTVNTDNLLNKNLKDSNKIKVLDTQTGFLRVRKSPDIQSEILTQVKPGEVYDVIDEKDGWYKIKIIETNNDGYQNEINGWVSGEFVSKQESL